MLRYIRSAPLTTSHRLAAQALAGWQTQPTTPSSPSSTLLTACTAVAAPTVRRRRAAASMSREAELAERVSKLEAELAKLSAWRSEVAVALTAFEVAPAPFPRQNATVVQPVLAGCLPYVISCYGRYHAVSVGYPENPHLWVTACGWPFGASDSAKPAGSLPTLYKAYCEKCLRAEREEAKAKTKVRVVEDGPAHKSFAP